MKGYKHFGVMLDCSRNAVMKPAVVKKLIDYLKKFGYNTLELYTEDTFRPDGEPYFGYLRGGYTGADIREIDAYAASRGVELIPCIQTLAHFTNLVKLPAYGGHPAHRRGKDVRAFGQIVRLRGGEFHLPLYQHRHGRGAYGGVGKISGQARLCRSV